MNLAIKDLAHAKLKFTITAMGVGMLLGIVLIMVGVYRGMIIDAQVILDDVGADLWIVQEDTLGPFAQSSRIHEDLKDTLKVQKGIDKTAALAFMGFQITTKYGKKMRIYSIGYDPFGTFNPINPKRLTAGRVLQKQHFEVVVSQKLGFTIGDKIPLGRDVYSVVGITKGAVSSGGEPLIYLSLKDAQKLQFLYSNTRIRNDRKRGLNVKADSHLVNTIVATVKPGFLPKKIAAFIKQWKHLGVYTDKEERWILTKNVIEMARKQIGMFTFILIVVSTIIIALIIYTMTLEKIKEIAIMKLIGIPNGKIISMITQETLTLGILAFVFANIFAHSIWDKFPKRVVLLWRDAWGLFGIVLVASFLASLFGVYKAIRANEREVIGG